MRVQAELWAAALSNPELREKFRPRLRAWKEVVLGGTRAALAADTGWDVNWVAGPPKRGYFIGGRSN